MLNNIHYRLPHNPETKKKPVKGFMLLACYLKLLMKRGEKVHWNAFPSQHMERGTLSALSIHMTQAIQFSMKMMFQLQIRPAANLKLN